jgi:hypothetical protein
LRVAEPALEAHAICVAVSDHVGANVGVDHDQPVLRLASHQLLQRSGRRVGREGERAKVQGGDIRAELGQVVRHQICVRRAREVEAVASVAVAARVHDGDRRRRRATEDVAVVDAALTQEANEELAEPVV